MDDKTKQLHDLEQALATMAENMPPMWWRVFCELQQQGFMRDEAFRLVGLMVFAQSGGKMVQ